jgi:flavorubredoxin
MSVNIIDSLLLHPNPDMDKPILLFEQEDHRIYWLGVAEDNAFRINVYIIEDGEQCFLVDPGSRSYFESIKQHTKDLGLFHKIEGLILCHQDPDVAASMFDWLQIKPDLKIITSARTNILIPHYGVSEYDYYDTGIANNNQFVFKSGRKIKFVEAPFLHFPGAIAPYDEFAKVIFSGDVWAGIDFEYQFIINDFQEHKLKLDLFHIDYMASNIATKSFAEKLVNIPIDLILPQHGAIIPGKFVNDALDYLIELKCGLDVVYPDNQML